MNSEKDFYTVLGILPDAEDVVVIGAYRALASRYHPDRWQGDITEATLRMGEINVAYGVLSNAVTRREYDDSRKSTDRSTEPRKATPAKKRSPKATMPIDEVFMNGLTPSPALAAIVGADPLPRTEVVSKLWDYIKKHHLQDKYDQRMINTDATFKKIFRKDQVTLFDMAGLIGKHLK